MRDDLIPEENEIVYEAMKRLTDKEMFDRTFRLRRAVQLNMTKAVLPPEEWISIEKVPWHSHQPSPRSPRRPHLRTFPI